MQEIANRIASLRMNGVGTPKDGLYPLPISIKDFDALALTPDFIAIAGDAQIVNLAEFIPTASWKRMDLRVFGAALLIGAA